MIDQPVPEEPDATPEPPPKSTTTIPVAGIGGSAGGLEVFKHLLADLPADTGLAIVFVQHLDPKHHSLLSEILARSTSMPVREAADGMPVEANHVYVIPPASDLTIAQGALRLTPAHAGAGSAHADRPVPAVAGRRVRQPGDRRDPLRRRHGRLDRRTGDQSRGRRDLRAGPVHGQVRLHAAGGGGHELRGFRSAAGRHCRRTGEGGPAPVSCRYARATGQNAATPTKHPFGAILAIGAWSHGNRFFALPGEDDQAPHPAAAGVAQYRQPARVCQPAGKRCRRADRPAARSADFRDQLFPRSGIV